MPICPKCKSEFREGFTKCNSCKVPLIDELEKETEETEFINEEEWVFLINVSHGYEIDNIEGIFEENDIPLLKKHKGSGELLELYMGTTSFGIDLYVPVSLLEKSKEIIGFNGMELTIEEPYEEIDDSDIKRSQVKRKVFGWILLMLCIPGLIIITILIISQIIDLVY